MDSERYLSAMRRMMETRNYSSQSIGSYLPCLKRFLIRFGVLDHPKNVNKSEIEEFLIECGHISKPFQKQCHCAVQLFYKEILEQPHKMDGIRYPRWQKKISVPLDADFVRSKIQSIRNRRDKAILALLFSTGIRRQEAATLKLTDIDSKRMFITVHMGKGGKDRLAQLSPALLEILRDYIRHLHYRPKTYLFETMGGRYISPSYILSICHQYLHCRTHQLRHSYATELWRNGVDLKRIQTFLGHKDIRTTEIYLHVDEKMLQDTFNPLDQMKKALSLQLVTKAA